MKLAGLSLSGVQGARAGALPTENALRKRLLALVDLRNEKSTDQLLVILLSFLVSDIFIFDAIFEQPYVDFGASPS